MRIPKKYGQSRIDKCPFCDKTAITQNNQGVPVCSQHKNKELNNLKCFCGEWLDLKISKYGAYFHCMNCGNISFKKGIESNPHISKHEIVPKKKENKKSLIKQKEMIIRSDELDF